MLCRSAKRTILQLQDPLTQIADSFGLILAFLCESWLTTGYLLGMRARPGPDLGQLHVVFPGIYICGTILVGILLTNSGGGPDWAQMWAISFISTHFTAWGPDLGRRPSHILGRNKPSMWARQILPTGKAGDPVVFCSAFSGQPTVG